MVCVSLSSRMRVGTPSLVRRLCVAMSVAPPPVVVRTTRDAAGTAQLSLSLQVTAPNKPPKERTLLRSTDEPLAKSLARIGAGAVLRDASNTPIDPQKVTP